MGHDASVAILSSALALFSFVLVLRSFVHCLSRGLLASKMIETAAGMVDNFLSIVQAYGFFPNGTRTYYENRRLVVGSYLHRCSSKLSSFAAHAISDISV